jgi:lipoprotein NlpD
VRIFSWVCIIFLFITCFTACETTETYAPVIDAVQIEPLPKSGIYRVSANDTLYSIAWRYGMDYRDLAQRNHIARPYHIEKGQLLYLAREAPVNPILASSAIRQSQELVSEKSTLKPAPISRPLEKEPAARVNNWRRPAQGPIIGFYSTQNKGLNFGGRLGDPIFATAAGKVVYSGNGLRGYGNLIIIKHNSTFLTAYAHNSKVFVKEGDWVKAGEKIAEMGNTGTRRIMLHFEIRRNGKPVNPLNYL